MKFVKHTHCVVALEDTNWPHFWPLRKAAIDHRANTYAFLPKLCLHTILYIFIWKFMFLSFAKPSLCECQTQCPKLHSELRNINLHNVIHSLISWNPREEMSVVQISLLIVTFIFLISRILSLMQITKEGNPHLALRHVSICGVSLSSSSYVTCWMLVHAYVTSSGKTKWSGPHHTIKMLHFVLFHNFTCYTNSTISCIHVNTTKFRNVTCTLVATGVILRSLECTGIRFPKHTLCSSPSVGPDLLW